MTFSGPGVPVRDRVLLHLSEFRRIGDAVEVPGGMSQSGIALALDVNRSQVTRALSELKAKDLIDERVTYVKGAVRRCRTYSCTYPGEEYSRRLKAMLLGTPAVFRDSTGAARTLRMGEVFEDFSGNVPFSRFLIAVLEDRVLLDVGRAGPGARPVPVLLGVGDAVPAGGAAAAAVPEDGPAADNSALVPSLEASALTGPEAEEPPETVVMEPPAPSERPPDVLDYRATYNNLLPSPYYDPERSPVPPGTDPRDPRLYQGLKPRAGQDLPLVGVVLFVLTITGLIFMFSTGLFYGGTCICFGWLVVGLIISALLLVGWSWKVERTGLLRLPRRERLAVAGLLVVATVATLLFFGTLTGGVQAGRLGAADLLAILMIGLPLYGVVLVRSGIPDHVRAELGVSAGWFMLLASAGIQLFPGTVHYSPWMTGAWMTLGTGLVVMASDTGGLRLGSMFAAALPGLGGATALLSSLAIYDGGTGWSQDVLGLASLVAWVGLGLFLVALPFLRSELVKAMYGTLGSVALVAFGVALVFLGIGLVRAGIYVGAVELALAAPALYYGYRRFREASGGDPRHKTRFLAIVLLVVVVTLSRALFIF